MIKRWNICISGFLQNKYEPNGFDKLFTKLNQFSNPDTYLLYCPWNSDWKAIAEWIFRMSDDDVTINIFAYSWGVGYGFTRLARQLEKRNLKVNHAVLSDGVYYPGVFKWRALIPIRPITVPCNVRTVDWFYQSTNTPSGHSLVAECPEFTNIKDPTFVHGVTHQYMDDLREFHIKCLRIASM